MGTQLSLNFGSDATDGEYSPLSYRRMHVSKSTFLNGLASRVHRWFRLTPSFGPELVHEMIDRLQVPSDGLILDPFCGAGTTLIEAKMAARRAIGFEINPLLHFVNQTSLRWTVRPSSVLRELGRLEEAVSIAEQVRIEELARYKLSIPPIHNPTRWWRPDVLVRVLFLRQAISEVQDNDIRRFLLLALAGVLVPDLTNVELGRLQLHFIEREEDEIDVWKSYSKHVHIMLDDLETIRKYSKVKESDDTKCYLQDALDLSNLRLNGLVSAVITSPPYPNRYSYVWNTRPHMYMLGFMKSKREAGLLDQRTVGGTWGIATSELAKGVILPANQAVSDVMKEIVEELRLRDNLMANYVVHYFNRLSQQIIEMNRILAPSARTAYVVGNSRIKGTYIETDVLLAKIVERLGLDYKVFDIHRFRLRHSGVKLYESIVYAQKGHS